MASRDSSEAGGRSPRSAAVRKVTAVPVAPARPESPPPPPRPAILKGLADNEVTRLIGLPAFRRTDDPGAIWQYRDGSCLLDLYLHADGPVYRVVHFEFRPRQRVNETVDAARCFARLTAKHTLRTSGTP